MRYILFLISIAFVSIISCKNSNKHLVDFNTIKPFNLDSTMNMIVEIPAGSTAKFEMNKDSYVLEMDSVDDLPRYIDYLGYPGNYGMIPNTILPKNLGGDGDPLDVLLLGPAVNRGSVQKVKIIGVLELLDNGEQDDKLIAINPQSNWSSVKDMDDLERLYPGAKNIIATFFQNYKGKGQMQLKAWSGKTKAFQIIKASIPAGPNKS